LLERFAGSEQALIDKLVEKYGPEPPLEKDKRGQVATKDVKEGGRRNEVPTDSRGGGHGGPERDIEDRVPLIDARQRHVTTPALEKRYQHHPKPSLPWLWDSSKEASDAVSSHQDLKDRLLQYYSHYNPSKIFDVDLALNEWKGGKEELFTTLSCKYGPEPRYFPFNRSRERLYRMLAFYDAVALSTAESLLVQYATMENEMMRHLCQKYGPEPVPTSASQISARTPPERMPNGASLECLAQGNHPQLKDPSAIFFPNTVDALSRMSMLPSTLSKRDQYASDMMQTVCANIGPALGGGTSQSYDSPVRPPVLFSSPSPIAWS